MCKFPQVKIRLSGEDGNAFAIMARAKQAARRAGVSSDDIKDYLDKATAGDYNDLIQVTLKWWNCDGVEEEEEN